MAAVKETNIGMDTMLTDSSFFLTLMGRHTLPLYASADTCLRGWSNAQPQAWD